MRLSRSHLPERITADDGAWLLGRSRSFVNALIRNGYLLGDLVSAGEFERHEIDRFDVIELSRRRGWTS